MNTTSTALNISIYNAKKDNNSRITNQTEQNIMSKKSIRFFNDREVRAVWDEEHSKWWFSATDIVSAINDEEDYKKCHNYWKYLKGKLVKNGIQLVSVTNHFKFEAPDGKQRFADVIDSGFDIYKEIDGLNQSEGLMKFMSCLSKKQKRMADLICDGYRKEDILRILSIDERRYNICLENMKTFDNYILLKIND